MADPGNRYRSLTAAGLGATAASVIVSSTLRAHAGVEVHEVAPGRLSVSRTRRPGWAVAACVATCWIGGLGLLFLLVRQTDAGEVTVTDGPRGCTVTLPPVLDGPTVHAVEQALRVTAPEPPVARPVPAADDLEGRTVARGEVAALAGPASPPTGPPPARLRFAGGTVTVAVGRPVVLGRDPSPTGDAAAHRVPGDATTVSKSHLLVEYDGATLTVEDLGSTNGTAVERAGASRPLAPGERTPVADGDRIVLGALTCAVTTDPHGPEVEPAWS